MMPIEHDFLCKFLKKLNTKLDFLTTVPVSCQQAHKVKGPGTTIVQVAKLSYGKSAAAARAAKRTREYSTSRVQRSGDRGRTDIKRGYLRPDLFIGFFRLRYEVMLHSKSSISLARPALSKSGWWLLQTCY